MGVGRVFGELAILYLCPRTATVQAHTDCTLWVLDRSVFQMITQRMGMQRHAQLLDFIRKVKLFHELGDDRLSKIVDCLDQVRNDTGQ
jgi:CRP-like cAMP-binding protein